MKYYTRPLKAVFELTLSRGMPSTIYITHIYQLMYSLHVVMLILIKTMTAVFEYLSILLTLHER